MEKFFRSLGFQGKELKLGFFLLTASLVISFISFYFAFIVVSSLYRQSLNEYSLKNADNVSCMVYNSMLQLMQRGWSRDQVDDFIKSLHSGQLGKENNINIYRGKSVADLYGSIHQNKTDEYINEVFRNGEEKNIFQDTIIKKYFPLKSSEKCLTCHVNSKAGQVLGVLSIEQDIGPIFKEVNRKFIHWALVFIPIPFIMAFFISNFVHKRIKKAIVSFSKKISNINQMQDLSQVELEGFDRAGFYELNLILNQIKEFVGKVKNIALDKGLLEFEMRLLEKFIITSDSIKNWQDYLKNFLIEVNQIIAVENFFYIYENENEDPTVEVFWYHKPNQKIKTINEQKIKLLPEVMNIMPNISNDIKINNHNCSDSESAESAEKFDMKFFCKNLELADLNLQGLVGVTVSREVFADPVRSLIARSVLSMLLNTTGSLKAINKFTSDLEYLATRDSLTNLFNQRMFWELLNYEFNRATRRKYRIALLIIDLDNFKLINDKYGHYFGDNFLKEVSQLIRKNKREGDILARYGGDEFVMILSETETEQSYFIAKRIRDEIKNFSMTAPDGNPAHLSCSIGVAIFPDHAKDSRELFLTADSLMYKAKEQGKNTVVFPDIEKPSESQLNYEKINILLLKALSQPYLLIPYFQPILDIQNNKYNMHEALMRINSEGKIIKAVEFIDFAEKTHMIQELDLMLMEKIFLKIKQENYPGTIFLNISHSDLLTKGHILRIMKLLEKFDIARNRLVLELTERVLVKNFSEIYDSFMKLNLNGLRFAVDDFGSGYSPFQYIKEFPVEFIKIGGEFIKQIDENKVNSALVRSLVTLAHELNIKTIAENIENQKTFNFIKDLKLDYAQGYFLQEPTSSLTTPQNMVYHIK
jgi:diguanylate cyclase (GGDEF)-like protein